MNHPPTIAQVTNHDGVRYERRWVQCGKSACTRCPHGPYWYAVVATLDRRTTVYVGRRLVYLTEERVRAIRIGHQIDYDQEGRRR